MLAGNADGQELDRTSAEQAEVVARGGSDSVDAVAIAVVVHRWQAQGRMTGKAVFERCIARLRVDVVDDAARGAGV